MRDVFRHFFMAVDRLMLVIIKADHHDVKVKRWSSKPRLVKLNKRLGHALALPSLAAVLRPLKTSGQVPAARQGPSAVCAT